MAANVILYCLDELSDYAEYERLCDDLMLLEGYKSIEPLGGFKDKGRDAVHVSKMKLTTIFAYSVREDWRAKLAEDAEKIYKHGHTCNKLVFITPSYVTAGERDEVVKFVLDRYGWKLELYSRERLRLALETKYPQLIKNHPHIFTPDLFPQTKAETNPNDHLLISYVSSDKQLGDWITRKLLGEGYRIWSDGLHKLGEDDYPSDIDKAIKENAYKVIALYSNDSQKNPDVIRQRGIALNKVQEGDKDFIIPLDLGVNPKDLDKVTSALEFISFTGAWKDGLQRLLEKLESQKTPKPLINGKTIVAETFLGRDVLTSSNEQLVTNCFKIEKIPDYIYVFSSEEYLTKENFNKLRNEWPFRALGKNLFVSFQMPPQGLDQEIEVSETLLWREHEMIQGVDTGNLISELLYKSLIIKCLEKGFKFCEKTKMIYFPEGISKADKIKYVEPNGKSNFINAAGQRKYWKPTGADEYKYYLSPEFRIKQDLIDEFLVLVRVRVRISDLSNVPLTDRLARSRRKRLCKDWWNHDWLTRMLALCQFLADDNKIIISKSSYDQIIINAEPILLTSPIGIDEQKLEKEDFERVDLVDDDEIIEGSQPNE